MKRPTAAALVRALPEPTAELLAAVVAAADARELSVHAVGGPVRDLLLERPLADVDVVVEGSALELAEAVALSGARVRAHDRFGTVTLEVGDAGIDLATVRSERYAYDGALPSVEPGSLEDDLRRRDFSANALALPLSKAARERRTGIVDLENGVRDIEERRLRVLHPRSFHDDPTRALRAARLAPRLGFSLTRGSRSALRDALRDGAFGRVSGDRLRREIARLFEDSARGLDPSRALRLLRDWHVLGALEPGLELPREAVAPLRRLGRAIARPPWRRGRLRPWVAGLAVWLAPLPPALRRRSLGRFAVRGASEKRIADFPRLRDGWLRALGRARGRGAVDATLTAAGEEELLALYAWAEPAVRRRIARYAGEDRARRLPVSGEDLVELGLAGPAIGRALLRIRAAYLDGSLATREEALALAVELIRRPRSARSRRRRHA